MFTTNPDRPSREDLGELLSHWGDRWSQGTWECGCCRTESGPGLMATCAAWFQQEEPDVRAMSPVRVTWLVWEQGGEHVQDPPRTDCSMGSVSGVFTELGALTAFPVLFCDSRSPDIFAQGVPAAAQGA